MKRGIVAVRCMDVQSTALQEEYVQQINVVEREETMVVVFGGVPVTMDLLLSTTDVEH
jgi:hypothetical protein